MKKVDRVTDTQLDEWMSRVPFKYRAALYQRHNRDLAQAWLDGADHSRKYETFPSLRDYMRKAVKRGRR